MNYAAHYHIGYNQIAPKVKAKKAAPSIGQVCHMDATTKGRQRGVKGQTTGCADRHAADGFLKCSFLPKLSAAETIQDNTDIERTERDFYQSLSQLAAHYNLQSMQSRQYGYPYNIALALDDVKTQLRYAVRDWQEISFVEDGEKYYLICTERYDTGTTLYYIPVVPLYRLTKRKNSQLRKTAQLLQSVCSYLYHIAGIPYYRQEDSYLFWMYEMVTDWIVSDETNEETPAYISEIVQAQVIGTIMEQKIFNPHNLSLFENRLHSFIPVSNFEKDCYQLAMEAFQLYQLFPDTNLFRNAAFRSELDIDDEDYDVVRMDKYVSFSADAKGLLFQTLFDSVNAEFQESKHLEEPTIVKKFDGSHIANNNLDFETRVFELINELTYLLNSF